jgi:hypothetical protein
VVSLVGFFNGEAVAFQLGDVHCPEPTEITAKMAEDLQLQGTIVFLSDNGDKKEHYAIVDVQGLATPIIVPVEKLSRLELDKKLSQEAG